MQSNLREFLIKKYENDSAGLIDAIELYESIKSSVAQARDEMTRECQRHDEALRKLNAAISKARECCDHPSRKHHPDPSGNNDSFYECTICGAEF